MRTVLPFVPKSRKPEARRALNALIVDLADQASASAGEIGKAIREAGEEERLQRLCLALLDHLNISSKPASARKGKRRAA